MLVPGDRTVIHRRRGPATIGEVADIDRTIADLGRQRGSGLIVPPSSFTIIHYMTIIKLAELHQVPAIFACRSYIQDGALMSYGPDILDIFRRAAGYVDRILRGSLARFWGKPLAAKFQYPRPA